MRRKKAAGSKALVLEQVEPLIHEIRGEKVILDSDLARLYGVDDQAAERAGETESGTVSERFHVSAHRERERRFEVANCDQFTASR